MQIPTEHLSISPGLHYLTAGADASGENTATDRDEEGNLYLEILCPGNAAKLLVDEPPPPGTCARLRIYLAGQGNKKAVIDRDTDLLTADEYQKHANEVKAAAYEELKTWIAHKCFSRAPRRHAHNIVDVKWVGKWKKI